jgi:hypothetical protein
MTTGLTPEFNEVEHLQSSIRKWLNREIKDYFRDLNIDDDWSPDLTQGRHSLAAACLHKDADSLQTTSLRAWFFEQVRSQAYRVPYYGIPVSSFQESRKFQPQVKLYFREDLEDVDPDFGPVEGEISFRIMGDPNITKAQAQAMANRVKLAFGNGGSGYIWRKGKDMATYTDWAKGYQLQLLTRSRTEAREVISKVLECQNDTPNWKRMNYSENAEPSEAFPTIPEQEMIYGELRRTARVRPVADVRFQYALLHIHGIKAPVVLLDRSFTYSTALVT